MYTCQRRLLTPGRGVPVRVRAELTDLLRQGLSIEAGEGEQRYLDEFDFARAYLVLASGMDGIGKQVIEGRADPRPEHCRRRVRKRLHERRASGQLFAAGAGDRG